MIIEGRYKIWYQTIDKDGNVTGTGVYHKDYMYLGTANRIARQVFGGVPGIRYQVSIRNPFREYWEYLHCELCGRIFEMPVSPSGWELCATVELTERKRAGVGEGVAHRKHFRHVCPECFKRFTDLVDTIKKEHSNGL